MRRRILNLALTAAIAGGCILSLLGYLVRDRSIPLALCLYIPLLPVGIVGLGYDLIRQGRSFGKLRWGLSVLGLAAIACSGFSLIGRGSGSQISSAEKEVKILHWNVLWGGKPRTEASWASMVAEISGRSPDIIVLSEAPHDDWVQTLSRRMGASWRFVQTKQPDGSPYTYKMVVLSRWPLDRERILTVRDGSAMVVRVDRPERPVRLMVVDGQSEITHLRTAFLHDLSAEFRRADRDVRPIDIITGDFNAVSRSVGFDEFNDYQLASRSYPGWRASWPMPCPVYDIDHVWVRNAQTILTCNLFSHPASDHRGQSVRIAW